MTEYTSILVETHTNVGLVRLNRPQVLNALNHTVVTEVMDALEDILSKIVPTFFIQDEDEKKQARTALADGPIKLLLQRLDSMLSDRGGEYFADGRLTMADLRVFLWIKNLNSGLLDYVPTDIVGRLAPGLNQHSDRISNDPGVRAYYAGRD